jgi:pectate lyase
VFTSGNTLVNTTFVGNGTDVIIPPGTDPVFTPPYAYTPHSVSDVPNLIMQNAGANAGPFSP